MVQLFILSIVFLLTSYFGILPEELISQFPNLTFLGWFALLISLVGGFNDIVQFPTTVRSLGKSIARHLPWKIDSHIEEFFGNGLLIKRKDFESPSLERIQNFYKGAEVSWDIIFSRGDIERDMYGELFNEASLSIKKDKKKTRMYAFVGEAGSGKSTVARRMAADLSEKLRVPLLEVRNSDVGFWQKLTPGLRQYKKLIIVYVDEISNNEEVLDEVRSINPSLNLVLITTTHDGDLLRNQIFAFQSFFPKMDSPSENEIERILSRLHIEKNVYYQVENFNSFLELMYLLTSGEELSKRITRDVKKLKLQDETLYTAYGIICFCTRYRVSIPVSLFERIDQGYFSLINRSQSRDKVFFDNSKNHPCYMAKNETVAKIALNVYLPDPRVIFSKLLNHVEPSNSFERSFLFHLFREISGDYLEYAKHLFASNTQVLERIFEFSYLYEVGSWSDLVSRLGILHEGKNWVRDKCFGKDVNFVRDIYRAVNLLQRDWSNSQTNNLVEKAKIFCLSRPDYRNLVARIFSLAALHADSAQVDYLFEIFKDEISGHEETTNMALAILNRGNKETRQKLLPYLRNKISLGMDKPYLLVILIKLAKVIGAEPVLVEAEDIALHYFNRTKNVEFILEAGFLFYGREKYSQAKRYFLKILDNKTLSQRNQTRARIGFAWCLYYTGKKWGCLSQLQLLLESSDMANESYAAGAYHQLGIYYKRERDFPEAEKYFRKIRETTKNPRYGNYWEMGKILVEQKKPCEASEELATALKMAPSNLDSDSLKSLKDDFNKSEIACKEDKKHH